MPPEDGDELEVRIALTAFLRPFNVLGWAGLAIGDLQLVAPRDEVVLAAGLAWERRYGVMSWISSGGRQREIDLRAEIREAAVDEDAAASGGAVAHAHAADAPGVVEPEVRQERRREVVVAHGVRRCAALGGGRRGDEARRIDERRGSASLRSPPTVSTPIRFAPADAVCEIRERAHVRELVRMARAIGRRDAAACRASSTA